MPGTSVVGLTERGTRRLILHLAALDRLTSEPRLRSRTVLETELGQATRRLALTAAGWTHTAARPVR